MRSVQELLADVSRLEGNRLDEAVFECVRRGPKALDRLFAYIDSDVPPGVSHKVGDSIRRQWTRVQEALMELPPKAFASPGVKATFELGPTEAIARRGGKCIEKGMIQTAACVAAVLAGSGRTCLEQALLEARLSMAAGRPEGALARLEAYYHPGETGLAVADWLAAAAIAAGDPKRAFLVKLPYEADLAQASRAVGAMIDAFAVEELAACILEVARHGNLDGWELIAAATEEVWRAALETDAATVLKLAGKRADMENLFDAVESVCCDLESCSNDAARGFIQGELQSLISEANELIHDVLGKFQISGESGENPGSAMPPTGRMEGKSYSVDEACWENLLSSARDAMAANGPETLGKSAVGQDVPEEMLRVMLLAHAQSRPVSMSWTDGEVCIEVGDSQVLQEVAEDAAELDAISIERMLKSTQPSDGALHIIVLVRSRECEHAQALLSSTRRMLQSIVGDLEELLEPLPGPAEPRITAIRTSLEDWDIGINEYVHAALNGAEESENTSSVDEEGSWYPLEGVDCPPETEKALAAAHYLVCSANSETPSPDQAALISFLFQKAVQTAAEYRCAEALADYKLRPDILRATEQRAKRRRRIRPEFAEEAVSIAPEGVTPERVQGGLDRLATRVLDGSQRSITGDVFLMGLAFMCFDPLADPERSLELGTALINLDALCMEAERHPESCDWSELERCAHNAIALVGLAGGKV